MAFTHISFNPTTRHGAMLRAMLEVNEAADDRLADVRSVMLEMRDGNGSENAHYAEITRRFGFGDYDPTQGPPSDAQNAKARAAFEELDSAYAKTSGNGQVSDVRAARDQLFSRLRG